MNWREWDQCCGDPVQRIFGAGLVCVGCWRGSSAIAAVRGMMEGRFEGLLGDSIVQA